MAASAFAWLAFQGLRGTKRAQQEDKLAYAVLALAAVATAYFQLERIHFGAYLGLVAIFLCWVWARWGREGFARLKWPLWFAALALPIPAFWLVHLSFYLRQLSVAMVVGLLKLGPLAIQRDGNIVHFGAHWVEVSEACSGLRTLVTVLALCSALAYFERSPRKRAVYFALAVPAAILGNVLRILLVCLAVGLGWSDRTLDAWHEPIGWISLVLVLGFIFLAVGMIPGRSSPAKSESLRVYRGSFRQEGPAAAFLTALFLSLHLVLLRLSPATAQASAMPHQPGERSRISEWTGTDLSLSKTDVSILGTSDVRYREFARRGFPRKLYYFEMNLPPGQSATHPPEISLKNEGFSELEERSVSLGPEAAPWTARRSFFHGRKNDLLVYHWFIVDGYGTDGYLAHQWRCLLEALRGKEVHAGMRRISIEIPFGDPDVSAADREVVEFAGSI